MAEVEHQNGTSSDMLNIRLFDPGMTPLHRVGVGGLWITLRAIDRDHPDLREDLRALGGSWNLDSNWVQFSWKGDGKNFFSRLIEESFRLTEDGRFWFLGLGHPDDHGDLGVTLQDALLNTFLQHGRTRKADPSTSPGGTLTLDIDGQSRGIRFRRVSYYAHQREADFQVTKANSVKGWQFPGGAVRHNAFSAATELKEPPGQWVALLFAPIGAIYFRIRKRARGVRPQFCIALPEITDLETFARAKNLFLKLSVRNQVVSGTADAALRVVAELQAANLVSHSRTSRCFVTSFGVTQWASQQKTRIDVFETQELTPDSLRMYRSGFQLLPVLPARERTTGADVDQEVPVLPDQPQWETTPILDLIARNIVDRRPWWRGFAGLVVKTETRRQMDSYEYIRRLRMGQSPDGGLAAMVSEPDAFDTQAAKTIVRACHEAWRRRMGALSERARDRGERFSDLANREREKLRISFGHCRNEATLRAVLTDFWSRAGSIPELQEGWQSVLPYLMDERWQLARDLALLALASYAAPEEQEDSPEGEQ